MRRNWCLSSVTFIIVAFINCLHSQNSTLPGNSTISNIPAIISNNSGDNKNTGDSRILQVDYRKLVSRADLTYDTPVERSEEGQPIGNGTMGSLVWTKPSSLKFQINRVDVFGNNSDSDNFFQRNTDYCGGVGFVDIDFGEEIFTGPSFRQHLSCYDALETVTGNAIESKVLAWHEQDVMAIEIKDNRKSLAPVFANLRMLRLPETRKGDHSAISKIDVIDDKIVLTQEFREDDYYNASAVVIGITEKKPNAGIVNDMTVRLSIQPEKNEPFTIFIASAASFDPNEDVVGAAMNKLKAAQSLGFDGLFKSNQSWWHSFWEKAFIHLNSSDGVADMVEENYNYYLYLMGASSRGDYPTKFNGMLWITEGDARKWGGLYWGANQSCLYNALLPTNRWELMDPMFNMYSNSYDSFATAAVQQWGSEGIFIPETLGFDGMPVLPEDIAAEMRQLYLLQKPWEDRSEEFREYAFTKLPFHSRWNWKADVGWKDGRWHMSDKDGGPFGHVTHIFSRGAKIAYQYWLKYEYTQDEEWLKNYAYPMLKGIAEFYRNFPNIKKEKDGKYHFHHVNDNEAVWGAHNTVEEISSMMGIFPVVIKASEILKVDADMRPVWSEFHDNLAPLVLNTDYPDADKDEETIWIKGLPPVVHGNANRRPDPNTMPVWFFDLATLESDPGILEIANATYDAFFSQGINNNTGVNVLSKLPIVGTLLGREEATRYLIPNQIQTTESKPMANRMDLREGYQTTSAQRLGRAAEAVNYALCQSVPAGPGEEPVITVFPAWPKEWDAQFSLLGRGGFLITSSINKGKIEFVELLSQAGKIGRLRNPWPNTEVDIYQNGKKQKEEKGSLITFSTQKDMNYIVVPRGTVPSKFERSININ